MKLRLIGGDLKGKSLLAPSGLGTRPTAARVREALFNILGPRVPATAVLDLFAGSGALGLEALSRGAARAVFLDNHPAALEKNIRACRLTDRARIVRGQAPADLSACLGPAARFDLVFIDPPYNQGLPPLVLTGLLQSHCLNQGATVILEHAASEPLNEKTIGQCGFQRLDLRQYGKTLVSFMETEVK